MSKFVSKILMFFAFIVVIDITSGWGFNYLRSHAKGDTQKNYYISEICTDDIIILGSSRAVRHYDPQIIEDSLGMSCYNCGEPGCGIITAFARYSMIRSRHIPKIVIYEATPIFDSFSFSDYSKDLGRVRQHSDNPVIKQLFLDLSDELEYIRLLSKMYRNNSFILHNFSNYLRSWQYQKGYLPLKGNINSKVLSNQNEAMFKQFQIDSIKLSYIEKLIKQLQSDSVSVVFMASPKYIVSDATDNIKMDLMPIAELCEQYGVPFINNTYVDDISNNKSLFHDEEHLNEDGARKYTEKVCYLIKNLLYK